MAAWHGVKNNGENNNINENKSWHRKKMKIIMAS
jgi:hypothetical protein